MKAIELVEMIRQGNGEKALIDLVAETTRLIEHRKSGIAGAIREQRQKWAAVCARTSADPQAFDSILEEFFPKIWQMFVDQSKDMRLRQYRRALRERCRTSLEEAAKETDLGLRMIKTISAYMTKWEVERQVKEGEM